MKVLVTGDAGFIGIQNKRYKQAIQKEAHFWSKSSQKLIEKMGGTTWNEIQKTMYHKIYRGEYVKKTLDLVKPNINVLELDCFIGWFSIEMWKKGANVDAVDIAEEALKIGEITYRKLQINERRKNVLRFIKYDLNYLSQCPYLKDKYDLIVVRGTLHHVLRFDSLLDTVKSLMREKTLFVVDDEAPQSRSEEKINAIFSILLTKWAYGFHRIFRCLIDWKFAHSIVHCCGVSPFESITEGEVIENKLKSKFRIVKLEKFAGFIASLTCPFDAYPNIIKKIVTPILKFLNEIDKLLIRMRIVNGSLLWGVFRK